jgi:hypothetical protein
MNQLLQAFRRLSRTSRTATTQPARPKKLRSRPRLEALEDRIVPSVSYDPTTHTLAITGDGGGTNALVFNDIFTGTHVSLNTASYFFPLGLVHKTTVDLGSGDNFIGVEGIRASSEIDFQNGDTTATDHITVGNNGSLALVNGQIQFITDEDHYEHAAFNLTVDSSADTAPPSGETISIGGVITGPNGLYISLLYPPNVASTLEIIDGPGPHTFNLVSPVSPLTLALQGSDAVNVGNLLDDPYSLSLLSPVDIQGTGQVDLSLLDNNLGTDDGSATYTMTNTTVQDNFTNFFDGHTYSSPLITYSGLRSLTLYGPLPAGANDYCVPYTKNVTLPGLMIRGTRLLRNKR